MADKIKEGREIVGLQFLSDGDEILSPAEGYFEISGNSTFQWD